MTGSSLDPKALEAGIGRAMGKSKSRWRSKASPASAASGNRSGRRLRCLADVRADRAMSPAMATATMAVMHGDMGFPLVSLGR